MKVVSAFFADRASVYDQRLHVWGGVWEWYNLSAFPGVAPMDLAVIAQLSAEDAGRTHSMSIRMIDPSDAVVWDSTVRMEVGEGPLNEHTALAFSMAPRLEQVGRHVTLLQVGDDVQNAFAVPLTARLTPPRSA